MSGYWGTTAMLVFLTGIAQGLRTPFARWVAGGRAKSPFRSWRCRGSSKALPDWRSNGQRFVQGSVPVGREAPKPGEGSTGDTVGWRIKAQCRKCATGREGCDGRRAAGLPCQDGAVYYTRTHLANRAPISRNAHPSRLTEEQIIGLLKEQEAGVKSKRELLNAPHVAYTCLLMTVSAPKFHRS